MDYEIHIGEIFDLGDQLPKPAQVIIITQDQFAIIEQFADTKKDRKLNTTYIINQCEFTVTPHFKTKP